MSDAHKKSVAAALHRHHEKQLTQPDKPKRSNEKPEKEVEKICLAWMRAHQWSVQIYESKATLKDGVWRQQAMKQGNADCQGSTDDGLSVAIEFKAPGKLSTLRFHQRQFLTDKINANAFACVVDSLERLQIIYAQWLKLRAVGLGEARTYLLSMLPAEPKTKDKPLFED